MLSSSQDDEERRLLRAWLWIACKTAHVDTICGVVLLNILTPARTMPFASSFDLSEDSTLVIYRFVRRVIKHFHLQRDLEHTSSSMSSHSYRTFHSYHTSQVQ